MIISVLSSSPSQKQTNKKDTRQIIVIWNTFSFFSYLLLSWTISKATASTEIVLTKSHEQFSVLILLYFFVMIGHSWSLYFSQTLHCLEQLYSPSFHQSLYLSNPFQFFIGSNFSVCSLHFYVCSPEFSFQFTPLSNLIYWRNFNPCL